MGRTRLRDAAEVQTPGGQLRTALRTALREQKAAHQAVARQKQAVTRMLTQTVEAEAAIAPLEKAVKTAEKAHISEVAQAMVMEKPPPASTVSEAIARLVFAKDNVNTLRQARKTIESEIGDYEQAAVDSDVEVEKIISQIIADYVKICVDEAAELAKRLAPYRSALMAFVQHYQDRPTEWHKQDAFRKARQPLDDAANQAFGFFRSLRESETPAANPWKSIREGLRQNPDGAVLRHLVNQFDGLLDKTPDEPPQGEPAAPT
jgi:hypothetical protein